MAYCLFDVPVVGGCKIGQAGCNHGVLSLKVQQDGYNLQERLQPWSHFFLSHRGAGCLKRGAPTRQG